MWHPKKHSACSATAAPPHKTLKPEEVPRASPTQHLHSHTSTCIELPLTTGFPSFPQTLLSTTPPPPTPPPHRPSPNHCSQLPPPALTLLEVSSPQLWEDQATIPFYPCCAGLMSYTHPHRHGARGKGGPQLLNKVIDELELAILIGCPDWLMACEAKIRSDTSV